MSESSSEPFHRSMSTNELVRWLEEKGLCSKDCKLLEEEDFTGESFLLLDKQTCKDLGVGIAGQLLIQKLTEEAAESQNRDFFDGSDTTEGYLTTALDKLTTSEDEDGSTLGIKLTFVPCIECPFTPIECGLHREACQAGGAAAYVFHGKVWSGRQVLRVFFMNPEVLEGWRCEGKKALTTKMILKWASAWEEAPSAPKFEATTNMKKADVRVTFSEEEGCSSLVGMQATSVSSDKPTMTLNLSESSYPEYFLRHLVIHEFGHALGLEHEHQRSDFWENVKDFIDLERMRSDHRFSHYQSAKGRAMFGRDYLVSKEKEKKENSCLSEYDPKSIMHYWFAVDWLKDRQYHNRKNIRSDSRLNDKQKKCLLGIHDRNNNVALNPSSTDFTILEMAYSNPESSKQT